MGDGIVIGVLTVVVALVIRSMWKDRKNGNACSGCSGKCSRCAARCCVEPDVETE